MKKNLLAIYNICGIGGFQNSAYYQDAILSVLRQKGFEEDELKVVISSCCSGDLIVHQLNTAFGNSISYNWIGESIPLTASFNHTVKKYVEHFGEFDGYLYLDSGINLHDPLLRFDSLKILWDAHLKGNYAMTAAMPTNDDGHQWWGIQYPESGIYEYKAAQTTNLHCQIYSEEFRKAYDGKLHCDIFANDTSESVSYYLCAAIRRKFAMCLDLRVFHNTSMDGASIGWRGGDGPRKRLFVTEKTMDTRYEEGYHFGFGYEECNDNANWLHDPDKFDAEGYAKDERLHEFLRRELFLSKQEFNYDEIAHEFVPEGA